MAIQKAIEKSFGHHCIKSKRQTLAEYGSKSIQLSLFPYTNPVPKKLFAPSSIGLFAYKLTPQIAVVVGVRVG